MKVPWQIPGVDLRQDRGATTIEYGLVAMLLAVLVAMAVVIAGPHTQSGDLQVEQPKATSSATPSPSVESVSVPMLGTIAED